MKRALFTQQSDPPLLVELPGIEPTAKSLLTCRNAEFADAKPR
jgi:hypothetical protein